MNVVIVSLIALTAILAALTVTLSMLAGRFQNNIIVASRYNRTFDLSQARAEAMALELAISRQFLPDVSADPDGLQLRYGVLATRASVLMGLTAEGGNGTGIGDTEIAELAEAVRQIAPLLPEAASPQEASQILGILEPLNRKLARLPSRAHAMTGDVVALNQQSLQRVFHAITVMVVALVAVGMALLLLLFCQRRKLAEAARRDWLTGLPNRAALHEAAAALDPKRDHALVFVDLDKFKDVNDDHGHAAGDVVLREVAARLRAAAGKDAFLARLGGDEFAFLMTGEDVERKAQACCARVDDALSVPFAYCGNRFAISMSMGIAVKRAGEARDLLDLMQDADVALYAAKDAGGARHVTLTPDLRHENNHRRRLQLDLPAACDGQIHLVFQPITDLSDGRVRGFEALLRWDHPELGPIPPIDFIPLAEESGDILAIGRWVVEEGCRVASAWPDDIFLSLNVSAVQFADPGFVACVDAAVRRFGLASRRINLEITESTLISNDAAHRILGGLHTIGVRVSLDDFGTGYASMSYLRQYSFEKIKIDRSFVKDMAIGNNSFAIVSAVCVLARDLSAEVVAEGIETADHLDLACASGCSLGQGYLFARPMREADVSPYLANQELPTISGASGRDDRMTAVLPA